MDVKSFEFPEVVNVPVDKDLLAEAKKRGFYKGRTEYNDLFIDMIFGEMHGLKFKEGLDEDFKIKATSYLKTIICSLELRRRSADEGEDAEREAICVLLLSELAEVE